MTAAGAGDEETAALAASALAYAVGYQFGRLKDGMRWAALAHAFLDHLGGDRSRIRAWLVGSEGAMAWSQGDFEKSAKLVEQSIAMFVRALGVDHLDVALGSSNLAFSLLSLHRPEDALVAASRAVRNPRRSRRPQQPPPGQRDLQPGRGAPSDGAVGRSARRVRRLIADRREQRPSAAHWPWRSSGGSGRARHRRGKDRGRGPLARTRVERPPAGLGRGDRHRGTQFALARALWGTGGNKPRARSLAAKAREVFARHHHRERDERAEHWLAAHPAS